MKKYKKKEKIEMFRLQCKLKPFQLCATDLSKQTASIVFD